MTYKMNYKHITNPGNAYMHMYGTVEIIFSKWYNGSDRYENRKYIVMKHH
jgi:hypothetical protein